MKICGYGIPDEEIFEWAEGIRREVSLGPKSWSAYHDRKS